MLSASVAMSSLISQHVNDLNYVTNSKREGNYID